MKPSLPVFSNQFSQTWLRLRAMVPYTSSPWISATWVRCWRLGATPLAHLKTYASGQKLPFSDASMLSAMRCIACRRCFAMRKTFIACRAVNGGSITLRCFASTAPFAARNTSCFSCSSLALQPTLIMLIHCPGRRLAQTLRGVAATVAFFFYFVA